MRKCRSARNLLASDKCNWISCAIHSVLCLCQVVDTRRSQLDFCLKFILCFYSNICFQVYSLHSFVSIAENRTNLLPRDVRYSVFFLCGSWCRCNRVTHGAVDRNSTYKDESISDLEMEALQVGVIVCQTCGINC